MFEDITRVSQMAKVALQKNPNVINATIGVLLDDNGDILYSNVFDSIIPTLTPKEKYPYEDVLGSKDINDNLLKFLKQEKFNEKEHFNMVTSGGTGALSNVISAFRKNAGLIVSDLCWVNYLTIARNFGVDTYSYELFKNEGFNLEGFKKALEQAVLEKDNVLVIINTPSQNPTGYDISNEEMKAITDIVNGCVKENKKITVILDIAYYNFGLNQNLDAFLELDENVVLAIAYSFSKSFGIYGFRLGSLTLVGKGVKEYEKLFYTQSRTKWSNPNKLGCSVLGKVLSNDESVEKVYQEIAEHMAILENKTTIFKEALKKNNIKTFPFTNGFFLSIPVENAEDVALELSKNDVYLTTVAGGIRVAISGVPSTRLEELAEKIAKVINK
ncbi:MAG: aminotransferase class I/II-fold pyridoxal phosphate-dependent enzyme [Bacilli bacterium]|nr:aminotransferase class I/II-fold pyridoxal phosphate-dependent enzyme [Bacilli bacterium]